MIERRRRKKESYIDVVDASILPHKRKLEKNVEELAVRFMMRSCQCTGLKPYRGLSSSNAYASVKVNHILIIIQCNGGSRPVLSILRPSFNVFLSTYTVFREMKKKVNNTNVRK